VGEDGRDGDAERSRIVRAAQRGDAFAMDELITLLTPYVGRLCAGIAQEDAADAMQEVFIAVFRNIGRLERPEALFGWVRTIAVREAVRVARERRRHVPTADLEDVPSPGDPLLGGELQDVLRRLSPEHRSVLLLRHLEGLSEQAVARLLELPVGTVRSRLFRARVSFRRSWR
jgi:RNA polymerase sigma-70 factor (ECF subfamily)